MSDLTQVEVLWLEKRIENRVRFGRIAEEQRIDQSRRILSFAPAASLPSSAGRPTTLEHSFRASMSCERSRRDSAARPCPM